MVMQEAQLSQLRLPRPIEGGRIAQAIVEYTGRRMGGFAIRGPSGKSYRFSANLRDRLQYVRDEDLERFRLLRDFRVLEEGRIDPEAEKYEALKREIKQELLGEAGNHVTTTDDIRRQGAAGGRPAGKGFGALLDCLLTCRNLEDCYGGAAPAYDAAWAYYDDHGAHGLRVPPRERFASVRSHGKRKREEAGRCLWAGHPEPIPEELNCS